MISPKKIIENKVQTLANNLGDPLENVSASAVFGDIKNTTTQVFDASGAMSVMSDQFSKVDVAGLATQARNLGQKIPALADVEDINAIFPPSLNQFANGAGAAAVSKAESLVEQVVPSIKGMSVDEIVDTATKALDEIGDGIINAVEQEVEAFQEKHKDTARGEKSQPEKEPKAPGVTLKNPLRSFNSCNAIFSLGVLTADSANNPSSTYIPNGADFTILRSGGGGIDEKRIQSIYDTVGNESGNTEYFIDDFDMTAVVASNNKTGATQAINFSFSVKEPYSMGVFLQALQAAAFDAGFENYLQAPYLLELDFVGWNDEGGKPVAYSNRKLPFKLISIEFDVESGGSTYQVQCIPWNEQTFSNDVQELQDTISITGRDMLEILSVGEQSLSTVINDKLQHIANESCQPATDYYLIRFPTTREGDIEKSYLRDASITNQATVSDSEAQSSRKGDQAAETEESGVTAFFKRLGVDTSSSALLQTLKGDSIQNLNKIGASLMISDFQEGGDNPFGLGLYAYDSEANVYKRNGVELTMSDELRTFKFTQGTPITKVIEELVLVSEYGRTALNRVDSKGEIDWFRIESKCYIIDDREYENATGETPKIYVYDVVPYKVDASRFSAPNQANAGLIQKAKHTVKTYNYIYSGTNEDVLGFDIKFNAAFFQAIRMDMGQLSASDVVNDREKQTTTPRHPTLGPPRDGTGLPEGRTRSVMKTGNFNGGSYNKQYGEELAKMFHNALINSKVDLITAELEIWGDPYFIPDSGVGNFTSPRGGSKNITASGSLDHQRNEIDIVVNFRTPVDYNQDGSMLFPGATVAVDSFSGVYQVIQVTSRISGNKFTQTLELVRRRNQSTEGISEAKALVEKPGCAGVNPNPGYDGEVIGSDPNESTTTQPSEIVSPYGSNGELATIRSKNGKTTQVAKVYQEQFQALIDELENDLGYEVRTLGGYVQRTARGSSSPSYHASGLAIDINAAENPMVRPRPDDAPEPTDMPSGGTGSAISALASKHGLGWGGDWNSATDSMHFSAAKSEGGSLDWPRNGLIPGGEPPPQPAEQPSTETSREPEQNNQTSDVVDDTGGVQNVRPRPGGQMSRAWDRSYGNTHNRDGTPKQSYVVSLAAANNPVSGVNAVVKQETFQSGQFGESTLRPYFPTEARDDLYDVRSGDKIKAIANFYTNQGVETSNAVTRTQSGITYNEFGDPVYTGNRGTTAI